MDSNGEYWDEITQKKLDQEGVRKARLDEMKQIHQHDVYTKVPERMCIEETGRKPVSVRWLDIIKGDEVNPEYRNR